MQAAQIRIVSGQDEGRSFILEEGQTLVIGRSSTNSATRLTDLTVSRKHCEIQTTGGQHILHNLSNHGTFVAGKPITRHVLEPGDVIQIGATKMAFFVGSVSDAATVEGPVPLVDSHLATLMPVSEFPFLKPPREPGEVGRLDKYRVLRQLGIGGMGIVFLAKDPSLDRLVALKVMKPEIAADVNGRQRFLREAKAMGRLKHDHVVTVYQVCEENDPPFLAMEFLEGESLDDRLEREQSVPFAEVLRIGRETAEGLAAAHAEGLIHRDIKPDNIWLEAPRGRVKILDFGLARPVQAADGLTRSGFIVGTLDYMSPEQARGREVDFRCDLFSLGCVLYQMCTTQRPFQGADSFEQMTSLVRDEPPSMRKLNPTAPLGLVLLIEQLLAKSPERRPASAQAVVDRIRAIEQTLRP